ncbi:hypothetical protein [Desulfomonile tiedjei]|uniref:Uncharacterized protein n=1 Tax=Desulfomonile tiedjei (strain ATCC 49306 / DSM 6799 / DCB-1) TaxID=706587 RepID=I4C5N8_DESTA|nr:hypothetical protein [Desulfomonile tiedjei]AFM24879.1 hypothetical protein Desti_2185 [Desulfomonile tiedjei DSM 6799]
MFDKDMIRRMNNNDLDAIIRLLELNEDRLHAWLIEDAPTVVRDDLDASVNYVRTLREIVKAERPDYVSPYESELPIR